MLNVINIVKSLNKKVGAKLLKKEAPPTALKWPVRNVHCTLDEVEPFK
jgi:hypothetical protein